jgi:hypothetical protein
LDGAAIWAKTKFFFLARKACNVDEIRAFFRMRKDSIPMGALRNGRLDFLSAFETSVSVHAPII